MKWDNLSLRERSELMRVYMKGGTLSISDMKKHYNSFDDGGKLNSAWDRHYTKENEQNIDYLYNQHRRSGLSYNQTIALLSNYIVESGADPRKKQIEGGQGEGLIQFTDSARKNNLEKFQPPHEFDGVLDPELQRQAKYITTNIANNKRGEWRHGGKRNKFNSAKEAREAFYNKENSLENLVEIISENYVRPGKPHLNRRKEVANYLSTKYLDNPVTDIFFK